MCEFYDIIDDPPVIVFLLASLGQIPLNIL